MLYHFLHQERLKTAKTRVDSVDDLIDQLTYRLVIMLAHTPRTILKLGKQRVRGPLSKH